MAQVKTARAQARIRHAELKQMLETRQRELGGAVRERIRDVRADATDPPHDVRDDAESSQTDSQEDVEFALIQLKAETLTRITAALAHLEAGTYGRCLECGDDIAEARLRALPFAARCRSCEETRESAELRERSRSQPRRGAAPLGFDL